MMSIPVDFTAACTRTQAELLLPYDHFRVQVGDVWVILLTYHWYPFAENAEPYTAHFITQYAMQHPEAPLLVQAVIDSLEIQPTKNS